MTLNDDINILRDIFDKFKIINATDYNLLEILELNETCKVDNKLIVFIKRNNNNARFFELVEDELGDCGYEPVCAFIHNERMVRMNGYDIEGLIITLHIKLREWGSI